MRPFDVLVFNRILDFDNINFNRIVIVFEFLNRGLCLVANLLELSHVKRQSVYIVAKAVHLITKINDTVGRTGAFRFIRCGDGELFDFSFEVR